MLTQIQLQNFKCFDSLTLPLSPLTLLTGFNAAGKSTTLQSILLLTQALRTSSRTTELPLNGPLSRLGSPGEIVNSDSGEGDVIFGIDDGQVGIEWTMQAEDRTKGIAMQILKVGINSDNKKTEYDSLKKLDMLLPHGVNTDAIQLVERLREVIFLSAVRMGTAEVFPSPDESSPIYADVGVQGEFAPWWFQKLLDEEIDKARCHPSDEAITLRRQFNAWASQLFPEAQGNAILIEKTNLVRLELRIGDIGDFCRPSNIGYGLTYAFPVIVAGLLAKPGQILIVDSPEAHLHPMGQSQMGIFLAQVAAAGVQVIIETHSDHIINGLRVAVKDGKVKPEIAKVLYFNRVLDSAKILPRVTEIPIDKNGELGCYPKGFLDEWNEQLMKLI